MVCAGRDQPLPPSQQSYYRYEQWECTGSCESALDGPEQDKNSPVPSSRSLAMYVLQHLLAAAAVQPKQQQTTTATAASPPPATTGTPPPHIHSHPADGGSNRSGLATLSSFHSSLPPLEPEFIFIPPTMSTSITTTATPAADSAATLDLGPLR